jgi:hypothetical protein
MSEEGGQPKELDPNPSATESSSNPSVNPDLVPTIASSLTGAMANALEPKFIGPYKLLHRLGVGGMGQVWLAEQTAPVQRQVALRYALRYICNKCSIIARLERV